MTSPLSMDPESPNKSINPHQWTEFTAYYKILPHLSGRRTAVNWDRQRLSKRIEDALVAANITRLNLGKPVAVKPQMGQYPDIVTIHGFWRTDNTNDAIECAQNTALIHSGTTLGESTSIMTSNLGGPFIPSTGSPINPISSIILSDLYTLINTMETEIEDYIVNLVKIIYKNIIFGSGGFSIPTS